MRKDGSIGVRQNRLYDEAIDAAYEFGRHRLEDKVRPHIAVARLYVNALRSLDVYGPTQKRIEEILGEKLPKCDKDHLRLAIKGLHMLLDARYHPQYRDHRVFPSLRQYHESLTLVAQGLASARDGHESIARVHDNFLRAVETVITGNGMLVVDWRRIVDQTSTHYTKVNLDISRLVAGEFVGVYRVTVKANGRVPHHSHVHLDEHHFLPEAIRGVHQIGSKAARCTQSDIVYINHGNVHAFRNDEDEPRAFLFVCGSRATGPWDFVQDIRTYPNLDFPTKIPSDLGRLGGQRLGDQLADLLGRRRSKNTSMRLTPRDMALFHDTVCIADEYSHNVAESDLEYFVANGKGQLELGGNSKRIERGDVFVVPMKMDWRIVNCGDLILYRFGLQS
jgi:mannose-6-phosphate isomerase-like protein (cupin superfamily)